MSRLPILEYPDPRLRLRARPVDRFDDDLARLVDDLVDTLSATGGIGLCAPQVNHLRRVLVLQLSGDPAPQVYVNPEIESSAVPALVEESCLSVPGFVGNVIRATRVLVRAQDVTGAPIVRELEGMAAVCLQHEVDHLDGVLFVDRLPLLRRLAFRAASLARSRRRVAA